VVEELVAVLIVCSCGFGGGLDGDLLGADVWRVEELGWCGRAHGIAGGVLKNEPT
jgi:hypothetical protein